MVKAQYFIEKLARIDLDGMCGKGKISGLFPVK